jgi:diguanylate cyclase
VACATMALWVGFAVRNHETHEEPMRMVGGVIMGIGIAAMHYTAMQAVSYSYDNMAFSVAHTVRVTALGELSVTVVAAFILIAALATSALEKKRFRRLQDAHKDLATSQEELLRIQQQLRDANALLSELSIRDGLTGLYNRRHFDTVIDTEWRRAVRSGNPVSLLMLDLDCFKKLNDTYGHQRGDECLREIASLLEVQPHRAHDIVARYGGEEFAILLPGATLSGAVKLAESIRRAVREMRFENSGSATGFVTISIGVCSHTPRVGEECDTLVREADIALYGAKQLGRNRVEVAGQVVVEA